MDGSHRPAVRTGAGLPRRQRYRAGDHVVTLAPGPDGRLVTSQRAVVAAVDPSERDADAADRRRPARAPRQGGSQVDRLDYGYATTVHRGQGSTTERAHLFADGGGRELAYVAMSRARQSTHVWAVADDLPQAVDDLRRDWSTQRTPTWAIDTALPDPATLTRERFQALPPISKPARRPPPRRDGHRRRRHRRHPPARPGRHLGPSRSALRSPAGPGRPGYRHRCLADHRGRSGGPGPRPGPPSAREQAELGRRPRRPVAGPPRSTKRSRGVGGAGGRRPTAVGNPRRPRDQPSSTRRSPSTKPASTGPPTVSSIGRPPAERSSTTGSNSNATPGTSPEPRRRRDHLDGLPSAAEIRRAATQGSNSTASRQQPSIPPASRSPGIEMSFRNAELTRGAGSYGRSRKRRGRRCSQYSGWLGCGSAHRRRGGRPFGPRRQPTRPGGSSDIAVLHAAFVTRVGWPLPEDGCV